MCVLLLGIDEYKSRWAQRVTEGVAVSHSPVYIANDVDSLDSRGGLNVHGNLQRVNRGPVSLIPATDSVASHAGAPIQPGLDMLARFG